MSNADVDEDPQSSLKHDEESYFPHDNDEEPLDMGMDVIRAECHDHWLRSSERSEEKGECYAYD